jgi:hypothetical protein
MAHSPKPRKPTSAAEYRKRRQQGPLQLPSGMYARLRRPGMDHFLSAGYLPDSLKTIITEEIASASRKPSRKVVEAAQAMSLEEIASWVAAMDRVAEHVFLEPVVRWHQRPAMGGAVDSKGNAVYEDIPEDERDEDCLYTDELEVEDKQFAFQYAVGGSADLERFRSQSRALVDGLSASPEMEMPPQPGSLS